MNKFFRSLLLVGLWPGVVAFAALQAQNSSDAEPTTKEQANGLRRLDDTTPGSASVDEAARSSAAAARAEDDPADTDQIAPAPTQKKSNRERRRANSTNRDDDRVSVFADTHVAATETVHGKAVAVMGDVTIDGCVDDDAVAVMGNNTVNGTVKGQVVAVLGDVTLGPRARVSGDVVSVGGAVSRDPEAVVEGKIVQQAIGKNLHVGVPIAAWWSHGLGRGRLLAFGAHLTWLWIATAVTLLFYVVLAAAFPRGLRRCADQLVERPGLTILTAVLSVIALPVVFVLLLVTIVGIPVAFVALPIGVLLAVFFGKAAIYTLVGRGLTGGRAHPVVAVLLGAFVFILLYLVPLLGIAISFFVSLLGFGAAVLALITSNRKAAPSAASATSGAPYSNGPVIVPPPARSSVVEPALVVEAAPGAEGAGATATEPTSVPPPPFSAAAEVPRMAEPPPLGAIALPRAGFWLRMAAMLIDLVLVAILIGLMHGSGAVVILMLGAYGAVMWKFKGTTVGGIVCGLKVVRLDSRPIDWPTAVVRALGCFLSLVIAGLGFVWVAFDDEKQSWHDKIAGTTVVKLPRGVPLV
ncbi:RDD family protein [Horticoccus luteus]|uniref:RDD family protein n=1 Tax=Horticoccus luteus TaxID=2862869 RepID=A0A8F9XGP4_9BACT|nr:RDD family protein [Horticoccus luteus]QYM79447.1 RDD family protein [Horticoccus luteus]